MSFRNITCLVFMVFTLPLAEDQFPRVIPDESEEQERPRNVVQSQKALVETEVHARNWSFVRMVSTHEVSTWPSYTFFFDLNAIYCNCSVALWVKINFMSRHSNPAVRTPNVNYGQFSLFLEIAISSLNSIQECRMDKLKFKKLEAII